MATKLRYGYFWPFPNDSSIEENIENYSNDNGEVSLDEVMREMDGRDTLVNMPVFFEHANDFTAMLLDIDEGWDT
jgi:hypothetical protein